METSRFSSATIAVMLVFLFPIVPLVLYGPTDQAALTILPSWGLTNNNDGGTTSPDFALSSLSSELKHTSGEAWSRTYGGPSEDGARSIVECSNGDFAIVGYTESFGSGKRDVLLVRTDANGNLLWNHTYGGAGYDQGYSIVECQAGGFALIGDYDLYTKDSGMWLLRTDADGNLLWNQTYGGTGYSIVECQTGGFAITGTAPQSNNSGDLLIFRTSENGTLLWRRTYGWGYMDVGQSIFEASGGGFAVAGHTLFPEDKPGLWVWLFRIDENGNHLWNHTYAGSGWDHAYSLTECSNGDFAISGTFDFQGKDGSDMYILRTDADGALLWNKTYGGSNYDEGYSIVECNDEGLAVVGYTKSIWSGFDLWLVRIDVDGNLVWDQSLGGGGYDIGYSIVKSDAGGFAIVGVTDSFGVGDSDIWLLRISTDTPAISLPTPVPWGAIAMAAGLVILAFLGISLALKPHKINTF